MTSSHFAGDRCRGSHLLLCFLVGLFPACDLGVTTPPTPEAFSFRLVVKDPAGNPMPNVRVSVYPPFALGMFPNPSISHSLFGVNASSTVGFAIAAAARVTLSLNDLDGTPVQTLIENELRAAGMYAYTFSLQRRDGARVMVCRLVATDASAGSVAFCDSIYVTLWQPDAEAALLGYTSGAGTFESRDTLAFPYILSLPPIVVTRDSPTPLGIFSFPDSCVVTLTDTSNATRMTFGRHLVHGPNDISVTWSPTGKASPVSRRGVSPDPMPQAAPSKPLNAFEWRLYQNYPNPFN